MHPKKFFSAITILVISAMILGACAAPTAPPPQTIVQTVVVAGTPQVQTIVITATPEAPSLAPGTGDWRAAGSGS